MQQSAIKMPDFLTYWSLTKHVRSQGVVFNAGCAGRPGATRFMQLWNPEHPVLWPATEIIVLYEADKDGFTPLAFIEGWWETRVEPTSAANIGWYGFDYTPRLLNELHESALKHIAGITT